jgi:hypothetical protein
VWVWCGVQCGWYEMCGWLSVVAQKGVAAERGWVGQAEQAGQAEQPTASWQLGKRGRRGGQAGMHLSLG